ncbi:MAG: DUF1028 domain-containing protein [Planctomycetes bacterium]|nr:DUF1028 domain-containing protein [Planctomycetota bacterium]
MPRFRALVAFVAAALLLALPAAATWSIVVVDLATGEVAVAIATCLTGFDLRPNTVVVVPGYGVAAAQSFVGPLSLRQLIRSGLLDGDSAAQILADLAVADAGHQTRQYGIVSLTGGEVTFTGSGAGAWAGGVTGQVGTLRYAIQGNVLTGQPVVAAAEAALVNTIGTLPERLMAAMEAARTMGGDGRCSCSASAPTSCGAPPPSFTKSSHIALMIVSRPSDLDAACSVGLGCGAGGYWLDLNIANQTAAAPDPVLQLATQFAAWQAAQVGRPDHYQSSVSLSAPTLRADGSSTVTGTVWLRDAAGVALGNSLPVAVALHSSSTVGGLSIGPAVPQPNGSYTFPVQGGFDAGVAVLDVSVTDAVGRVGIWPRPMLVVRDVFDGCGEGAIPNGTGGALAALRVPGAIENDRVATVGYGKPFTLALDAPVGGPGGLPVGLFALWGHLGVPPAGVAVPLGAGQGSLCYLPAPFAPSPTFLLADSFGLGGVVFAGPAPWQLPIPGVPALLDVALQGVMVVDANATFAATNAVLLRVVPLPSPVIQSVSPPGPTPGQLVTVSGSAFDPGMVATIAGLPVALTFLSPAQVSFDMPAGTPCDAPLLFANPGGGLGASTINRTPTITSAPATGPAAGGVNVTLVGSSFLGSTVTFNGAPMTTSLFFDNVIVGSLPPGVPGPATIVVTNPNGCVTTRAFTYL